MNDVIPRPSHPIKRIIMCGMKINIFIEIMNVITSTVKRLINLSSDIYEVEKFNTLAEMKITTRE